MSFNVNPAMNRRSLIAGVAGLGAASILAGCSGNDSASGSAAASSDAAFKLGAIGPLRAKRRRTYPSKVYEKRCRWPGFEPRPQ